MGYCVSSKLLYCAKYLVTVYKAFIRPHPDYGDIIYDQIYNDSFYQRMESVQYNAALTIRGTFTENLIEYYA